MSKFSTIHTNLSLSKVTTIPNYRWYLVLLSAHIKSPLPTDGLSYPTRETFEGQKDT